MKMFRRFHSQFKLNFSVKYLYCEENLMGFHLYIMVGNIDKKKEEEKKRKYLLFVSLLICVYLWSLKVIIACGSWRNKHS